MLIGFTEIIYLTITVAVVGYIFMGLLPRIKLAQFHKGFDWNSFLFACLVSAPGIVLHELSHKFVAIFYGLQAAFNIWPFGLFVSVFLKAIHSPFILIAPGYVSIAQGATLPQMTVIAFAGPLFPLLP